MPLYRVDDELQLGMSTIEIICGRPNPATELSFTGAKRGLKGAQRGGCFYPFNIDKARHSAPLVVCEAFLRHGAICRYGARPARILRYELQ